MEGPSGRQSKRTDSYTPSSETSFSPCIVRNSSHLSPVENKRSETTANHISSPAKIDHLLKELTSLISDHNAATVRFRILKVLNINHRDACTQTEAVLKGSEKRDDQTPPTNSTFHTPAANTLSGLRKRKRGKSIETPPKRTASKGSLSPGVKSPGRAGKQFDLGPDDISCALCSKQASSVASGYLYGPYKAENEHSVLNETTVKGARKRKSVSFSFDELFWLHDMCAVWSQSVYLNGTSVRGLEAAIQRGNKTFCHGCGSRGATVSCAGRSVTARCDKAFHYHCAVEQGCHFKQDELRMLCPQHSQQQQHHP